MTKMKPEINNKRQEKKPTNAQLLRRLANAIVLVEKTKDTKSIFFSDKGLRLTVNTDYAVIETGYHRHVFSSFTASGVSRPWIYINRFVEIADREVDAGTINTESGFSYTKLMDVLKAKEDQTDYQLAWYVDKYLYNLHMCLYEINETEAGSFLVYERFMHNIARQSFLLEEHKEDVTNKQFVDKVLELEASFMKDIDERVILEAKTDEQRMQEEISAIQEQEVEQTVQEGTNGAE